MPEAPQSCVSRRSITLGSRFCQILAETHKKIRHTSTALFPRVPRGGIDSRSQPGQPEAERTIFKEVRKYGFGTL
eukprot:4044873-Prymnesium_polylepis.1